MAIQTLSKRQQLRLIHQHLGHPGAEALKKTLQLVDGVDKPETLRGFLVSENPCTAYGLGKAKHLRSQDTRENVANIPGEHVHVDVAHNGPMGIAGGQWIVLTLDEASDKVFVKVTSYR